MTVGLDGHCHCQSCSVFTLPAFPFKSEVGSFKVLKLAVSAVFLLRGVPVDVVKFV